MLIILLRNSWKAELLRLVEVQKTEILIDLEIVESLPAVFLGALVTFSKKVDSNNRWALCNLTPQVVEAIEITHLDRIWDVKRSKKDVLSAWDRAS